MSFVNALGNPGPFNVYDWQRQQAEAAVIAVLSVFNIKPDLNTVEGTLALETAVETLLVQGATWDPHPKGCV